MRFWQKAERVVLYKKQQAVETIKKAAGAKHLNHILDQTTRYSQFLAQRLQQGDGDAGGRTGTGPLALPPPPAATPPPPGGAGGGSALLRPPAGPAGPAGPAAVPEADQATPAPPAPPGGDVGMPDTGSGDLATEDDADFEEPEESEADDEGTLSEEEVSSA
jgi:hypothetical protein